MTLRSEALKLAGSAHIQALIGGFLDLKLRSLTAAILVGMAAQVSVGQSATPVSLDTSETLFTVLTAINTCGYDEQLSISSPLRLQVRNEVAKSSQTFDQAKEVTQVLCKFYQDHLQRDPSRTLAQYISLALFLERPPGFQLKVKEADLPPDAVQVSGIVPIIQKFYDVAGLHSIWEHNKEGYARLTTLYHDPLSKVLFDTEIYLKLPSAGYLGHTFTVLLDPMGAPDQTNARDYGADYYLVISPGSAPALKIEQIRHTYLHYLLDPLAMKYPAEMDRLKPLLEQVKKAPMDESFKNDVSLLVTESLIRAIEVRTEFPPKAPEAERQVAIQQAAEQGYVLAPYFYDALLQFEKSPTGMRNAYSDLLLGIDLHKEQRRAAQIQFASIADPELVRLSRTAKPTLLVTAEQRLAAGDSENAKKLAQEALQVNTEDHGRALFILAQVATMNRDMQGARNYFQQALGVSKEAKVVAWSHIYLGRIFDLQEDRAAALDHYRAALSASVALPEAKAAAERGLQQPYEPPKRSSETNN